MGLADGIYKYWKLDGTNKDEVSGNNNLTLFNNLGYSAAKINQGFDFNGFQKSAVFNAGVPWGISNGYTINFWVRFSQLGVDQGLLVRDDVYTSGGRSFQIAILGSTNKIRFVRFNSSMQVDSFDTATTFALNTWYMITVTFDTTNGVKLYVNNTLDTTLAVTQQNNDPSNAKLGIGTFTDSGVWFFQGLMDEISIWTRGLSSGEVSQLYNGGSGLQYPFGGITPTANSRFLQFFR